MELHPFFQGLLETLPEPGSDWPNERRERWLETARNIFALLYVDAGNGSVEAPAVPDAHLVRDGDEGRPSFYPQSA